MCAGDLGERMFCSHLLRISVRITAPMRYYECVIHANIKCTVKDVGKCSQCLMLSFTSITSILTLKYRIAHFHLA